MSSYTKWIPFELACRLRCLQQGSLNVGNTQQNIANLLSLVRGNANGGGGGNYTTLLHFDDGNGSTAFTDSGSSPSTWTATNTSGTAAESTAQAQFGSGSLSIGGNECWISTPQTSGGALDLTAVNAFTVEGWAYPTSTTLTNASGHGDSVIIDLSAGDTTLFELYMLASGKLTGAGYGTNGWSGLGTITAAAMTTGAWNHWAFVRNGNNTFIGLNGVLLSFGNVTGNAAAIGANKKAFIGADSLSNPQLTAWSGGFIDEVAISLTAKYAGTSYTVPSAPFSNGAAGGTYGRWGIQRNGSAQPTSALQVYPALVPGFVKPIAS